MEATLVGFYGDRILPRIVDVACNTRVSRPQRERVCKNLAGDIVEIGFGSGHNVPHYPPAVTRVAAIEPADRAWELAANRLRETSIPVQRAGLDGQVLPFADHSFDAALSTWTMCTIPDLPAALAELRRVLKPGGALHFVEHGLAPDESVRRWQRRLNPIQKRLFGGCHLNRPIPDMLAAAGFTIAELDVFYEESTPKAWGANSLGIAHSPA